MRQSHLFTKTTRQLPKDEVSVNAQLLIRAGFVNKLAAGIYSYLPLGLAALNKIKQIIREEMNALGGQEILMPALLPKENWEKTGRWDEMDVLFKLKAGDKEFCLGATHEEIVTPLVQAYANSYKDLPCAVYQIQDKFRHEPRPKSGLLRGREFSMKDLYSFHRDEADLEQYYEKAKAAYLKIFSRCGLDVKVVESSGGTFSKYSHEFQVLTDFGEDEVYSCPKCGWHRNKEIVEDKNKCGDCGADLLIRKGIEVGNIFPLKTKYSSAFDFKFKDEDGSDKPVQMGCYGIGPSRVLGAIVEVHHDDKGMIWPTEIAPFDVHLLFLGEGDKIKATADKLYNDLIKAGAEVLYDDRSESAGVKLNDADLIGLPWRIVISERTKGKVELKNRATGKIELLSAKKAIKKINL